MPRPSLLTSPTPVAGLATTARTGPARRSRHRLRDRLGLRVGLVLCLWLAIAAQALAQQADGPGRIARFEAIEGSVQFQSAADGQTRLADAQWPLAASDRVTTAVGSRAELHAASATLRLGEGTDLALTALDEQNTQIKLTAGTLGVQLRELQAGERFEVDTPNLALVLDRPGRWRIDVDTARGTTRVSAEQGGGTLYGADGRPLPFAAAQSREFSGRGLAGSPPLALPGGDAFEQWSAGRDNLLAQSPSLQYASASIPGLSSLDRYGEWSQQAGYGAIWFPRNVDANWSPYSDGRWEWIAPWGWTWVDNAPWGFAPSHYGRWTQVGPRWGWVPGPARGRPGYSAALPFHGARPPVPSDRPYGIGSSPRWGVPARIGAPIEPLADQLRRDQWQQNQRLQQDRHQAEMLRQQQQREAQRMFRPGLQPDLGQQQLEMQRRNIEQQQHQMMWQQQRQQQELMHQQQRQQQDLMRQQQRQQQPFPGGGQMRQPIQQPLQQPTVPMMRPGGMQRAEPHNGGAPGGFPGGLPR